MRNGDGRALSTEEEIEALSPEDHRRLWASIKAKALAGGIAEAVFWLKYRDLFDR